MARHLPEPNLTMFDTGTNRLERCGVIIADGGVHRIIELPNRSPEPNLHFVVWNKDIHRHLEPDAVIVGIVHTHPFRSSPLPSSRDIASIPRGMVGMVYHPSTTSVAWYDWEGIIKHNHKRKRRGHGHQ